METLKRILVASIFVPVFIFCIFNTFGEGLFLFLLLYISSILGTIEFVKIFKHKGIEISYTLPIIFVSLVWIIKYLTNFRIMPLYNINLWLAILLFIFASLREVFRKDFNRSLERIGAVMIIFFYLGVLFLYSYKIKMISVNGGYVFFLIAAITWLCDSGAYFIGKYMGKHKLNLAVSPKKTLEGFIGAIIFGLVSGLVFREIFYDKLTQPIFAELKYFLPFLILLIALTIFGDLIESVFKRSANVKDSEKTIPGHGGILDSFDSLIITSTITYLVLMFVF